MRNSFIKSFIMLCSFNRIEPGLNHPVSVVHFPLETPGRNEQKHLGHSSALVQLYLSNFYDVDPCDLTYLTNDAFAPPPTEQTSGFCQTRLSLASGTGCIPYPGENCSFPPAPGHAGKTHRGSVPDSLDFGTGPDRGNNRCSAATFRIRGRHTLTQTKKNSNRAFMVKGKLSTWH
ncbi:MAG: hypothetical protein V1793_18860 [Pseudomonadota bacterium]